MKLTNVYEHIFCYKHIMPPTCFSYCFGHPQGGALQRICYKHL